MSEYQYYEFQAFDRTLSDADIKALRALSSRARIGATSFTNSYDWGDFRGDPVELMRRWFDLHLCFSHFGAHRLMIKLPKRLVDRHRLDGFLRKDGCATLRAAGENLILDIMGEELYPSEEDDGSGWLAALAPLRADVLGGDLRLFYLLWLTEVEAGAADPGELEPMPGIGPLTGPLQAFAELFQLDGDLVEAAAENVTGKEVAQQPSSEAIRQVVSALPEREKVELLARLAEGEPHVASELRALVRRRLASSAEATGALRTVGDLRARARAIREAREQAEVREREADRKREIAVQARVRRKRLDEIVRKGDAVWREVETEIERRNPSGYRLATELLLDLKLIADESDAIADFDRRLAAIRERHARKGQFILKLAEAMREK